MSEPTANVPSPGMPADVLVATDGESAAGLLAAPVAHVAADAGPVDWPDWVPHAARSALSTPRATLADLHIACLPSHEPAAARPERRTQARRTGVSPE